MRTTSCGTLRAAPAPRVCRLQPGAFRAPRSIPCSAAGPSGRMRQSMEPKRDRVTVETCAPRLTAVDAKPRHRVAGSPARGGSVRAIERVAPFCNDPLIALRVRAPRKTAGLDLPTPPVPPRPRRLASTKRTATCCRRTGATVRSPRVPAPGTGEGAMGGCRPAPFRPSGRQAGAATRTPRGADPRRLPVARTGWTYRPKRADGAVQWRVTGS